MVFTHTTRVRVPVGEKHFFPVRCWIFCARRTLVPVHRLDGRAVQGAGFRHQSPRRRGFESHSNQKGFTFTFIFFFAAHAFCRCQGPGRQSELAQRKRVGLITQRSQDRNLDSLTLSRLAQLVERKTLNLVVVGSSPTVGISSCGAVGSA